MRIFPISGFLSLLGALFLGEVSADVLVKIPQGIVQGKRMTSRGGRHFKAFLGIPYAKQKLRFGLSYPAEGWRGVLNGTEYGPRCAQRNTLENTTIGQEDCLHINVFTPNRAVAGGLPVLVCIETGGLQFGGSDRSGPKYFLDHNVILVTFNYRLNVFGFLSTGDRVVGGNMGLKDQVLALEWVQRNIKYFGGSPQRVTIFGESAGGASVTFHLLSKQSKGLFAQGISQSGSALSSRMFNPNLRPFTEAFAEKLGCPPAATNNSQGIVNCLRAKTVDQLLQALTPEGNILHETTQIFVGTLEEKGCPSCRPFLTEMPSEIMKGGRFHKVPIIMTLTNDEGLLRNSAQVMKSPELLSELNCSWFSVAPLAFHYWKEGLSEEEKRWISTQIRNFYFGKEEIGEESFPNLTACYSDSFINSAVKRHVLSHAAAAPVYAAVFNISGIWPQIFSLGFTRPLGMGHSDDLQYFFNNSFYPEFEHGSKLEKISQDLVSIWVNFATNGHPNTSKDGNLYWRRVSRHEVSSGVVNWQYFGDTEELSQRQQKPLEERLRFWDSINNFISKRQPRPDEL